MEFLYSLYLYTYLYETLNFHVLLLYIPRMYTFFFGLFFLFFVHACIRIFFHHTLCVYSIFLYFHSVCVDFYFLFFVHACIRTVHIFTLLYMFTVFSCIFTSWVLEFLYFYFRSTHTYFLCTVFSHIFLESFCLYMILMIFMYLVPLTIQFLHYRRCRGPKFILFMDFFWYRIYSGATPLPVLEHTEKTPPSCPW